MDTFSGLKVVIVQPQRIWVRRSWWERLFTWECGWRPFAAMKLVSKELVAPDKCYRSGNTLYCGAKFYEELKKEIERRDIGSFSIGGSVQP